MGKALYRKYRSRSLDEIVGQSHVVSLLKRSLENDTAAHAYLLTGIRGIGKTSIARILAHEIIKMPYEEGTSHLDVIEIDAASNNSVEDVRDLREKSRIAPVHAAKKVYIIDEVHMLSKSAFNALLKTLEEPPEHVVFILATTDVDKLPATILSRVQRFNLRPISDIDLTAHLRSIAKSEGIAIDDEALMLIAAHGNGSFRDSISLLDQIRSLGDGEITRADIEALLGLVEHDIVSRIFTLYRDHQHTELISFVYEQIQNGMPVTTLIDQLLLEGRRQMIASPELLPLLDKLVEARRSQWPDVKLLAAFIDKDAMTSRAAPAKSARASKPSASVPKPERVNASEKKTAKQTATEKSYKNSEKPQTPMVEAMPFAWDEFCQNIRTSSMSAFSILNRCGYRFDGSQLKIYTGKQFSKKQLEKSLPLLSEALAAQGVTDGTIELTPEPKPSENSEIAAALAIIGGEEVEL